MMDFGTALNALKDGRKVSREGWNGKGMWLALVNDWQAFGMGLPDHTRFSPWIGMKTADNCFVPWLASQTDILASDWGVV